MDVRGVNEAIQCDDPLPWQLNQLGFRPNSQRRQKWFASGRHNRDRLGLLFTFYRRHAAAIRQHDPVCLPPFNFSDRARRGLPRFID